MIQPQDYKTIKTFVDMINNKMLHTSIDVNFVIDEIGDGRTHFSVNGVEFIRKDRLAEVIQKALDHDPIQLGSLSASIIQAATCWPTSVIYACQYAGEDAQRGLAQIIMNEGYLPYIASVLKQNDRYDDLFMIENKTTKHDLHLAEKGFVIYNHHAEKGSEGEYKYG